MSKSVYITPVGPYRHQIRRGSSTNMKFLVLLLVCITVSLATAAVDKNKKVEKRGLSHLHHGGGLGIGAINLGGGDLDGFSYAPSAPVIAVGSGLGGLLGGSPIISSGVSTLPTSGISYAPSYGYAPSGISYAPGYSQGPSYGLGQGSFYGLGSDYIGSSGLRSYLGSGVPIGSDIGGVTGIPYGSGGIGGGIPISSSGYGSGGIPISTGVNTGGNIVSQHVTVTNRVAVPVPQPYPVPVERPVAVPVAHAVRVPVDRPYPVPVPHRIAVPVERPYPIPVEHPVAVPVAQPVPVAVPRPVAVPVPRPYPVPVINNIAIPVSQQVAYQQTVPIIASSPLLTRVPAYYGSPITGGNFVGGSGAIYGGAISSIPVSSGYAVGYPILGGIGGGSRYSSGGISIGGSLSLGPFGHISKHLSLS